MLKRYFDLTPDEQNAIHQWLNDHGIDHRDVPINTTFAYDNQTGEWTIDRYLRNADGHLYRDGDGPAHETVTFKGTRELPWPRVATNPWHCPYLPCGVTTVTAAEMVEHHTAAHRDRSGT